MSNLQTILQELKESHTENGESLYLLSEIKEYIKTTNSRMDEAENQIS